MSNSSIIIRELVKKSLFTQKQIEIITNTGSSARTISRGAYYRQRKQAGQKVEALAYSIILLCGLGVLPPDGVLASTKIADQLNVIFDGDIDEHTAQEVLNVVQSAVNNVIGK